MGGPLVFTRIEPYLQTLPEGIAIVDDVAKATGLHWEKVRDALYNNTRSANARTKKVTDKIYLYVPPPAEPPVRVKAVRGSDSFPYWELSGDPLADYGVLVAALRKATGQASQRLAAHDPAVAFAQTRPTIQLTVVIPVSA